MFDLFDFDLPGAVTDQLERRLQSMPSSMLSANALNELGQFQERHKLRQGVYQLGLMDEVVYVGKAIDVEERLRQHFGKLTGRLNLNMEQVRFRCLLLHPNWSTSANEDLLITHYKSQGQCKWNSSGFGAKDVGKERDGTEPSWFDREYPINADYPCAEIRDRMKVGELLLSLKGQLPFTFRYEVQRSDAVKELDLIGSHRTARSLIGRAVTALGPEWRATVFRSHIILYKERKSYTHGETIAPSEPT